MLLITGMPRSGTSFLYYIFEKYGYLMDPKFLAKGSWESIRSYESALLGEIFFFRNDLDLLIDGLKIIREFWKRNFDTDEVVYKHPLLVFQPELFKLNFVSQVIFCKRPLDTWILSAQEHEGAITLFNNRNDCKFLRKYINNINEMIDLGKIWEIETDKSIEFCKDNNIKYKIFNFRNYENYKDIMNGFNITDENCKKFWDETWIERNRGIK